MSDVTEQMEGFYADLRKNTREAYLQELLSNLQVFVHKNGVIDVKLGKDEEIFFTINPPLEEELVERAALCLPVTDENATIEPKAESPLGT